MHLQSYDKNLLHVNSLRASTSRAAVLLVHGYGEHSGRYGKVASQLNDHHIDLYTYDLRGHGRSGGRRNWIEHFEQHQIDLHEVIQYVRQYTASPFFLMGHSMGGTIVAQYCLHHGFRPSGVIFSSPAFRLPSQSFPLIRHLAALLDLMIPNAKLIDIGHQWLSRDPQVLQDIYQDPLHIKERMPIHYACELLRAGSSILSHCESFDLPCLIFHGTADRITDPKGSQTFFARCASTDKTLTFYEDYFHETFRDPGGERILTELIAWIHQHTVQSA